VTADPFLPLTRRSLLASAASVMGVGALLAACGSGDDDASGSSQPAAGSDQASSGAAASSGAGDFVVVQRFPNNQAFVPGQVRLAVSLARTDGALLVDGPDRLTGQVRNDAGEVIGPIDAIRRGAGLSVPYWSIIADLPAAGLYSMEIDDAIGDPTPVLVFDAAEITMPVTGKPLPPFDTPTISDARGVDPVCTRLSGACPFHELTLTQALALNKPVVYLVGTPAHCTTATCGPGLDFLVAASPAYADRVTFVHAEVYADPEGTTVAPAVEALTLEYEPVMFFTDAAGVVTSRVDIVWDAADLDQLLAAAFD
jgi:hypothetical protein